MNFVTPLSPDAEPGPVSEAVTAEEAAREARRTERLAVLKRMRDAQLEMAERMTDAVAGRLAEEDAAKFADVKDPCLAVARLGRIFDLIVKHEERIDVDAETRAAHQKAEAAEALAERERSRRRRETAPERAEEAEADARTARKRDTIRRAVTRAHKDAIADMDRSDRRDLLDEVLTDYEMEEGLDGDPAAIVLAVIEELGFMLEEEPEPVDPDRPYGAKKPPASAAEVKAKSLALAQHYLDTVGAGPAWADTS